MSGEEVGSFGALLREHRLAAGLSQEALAERAGLSARTISDLERGVKQAPYRDTVTLLARGLGLAPAQRATLEAAILRRRPPRAAPTPCPARPRPPLPAQPTPLQLCPSTTHWRVPSGPCTTRGPSSWNFLGRRFVHRSKGRCISRQCPSADTTPNLLSIARFPSPNATTGEAIT